MFLGDKMRTLLELLDIYADTKVDGKRGWDILGVGSISWSKWKNSKREMPIRYYKIICDELNMSLTDNNKDICITLLEVIYE
jgi:hypothetical protein